MWFQIIRVAAVVLLLGGAAAIATPRGRLPLALRGLNRMLGRPARDEKGDEVSVKRRLAAFVMVAAAVLLALYPA